MSTTESRDSAASKTTSQSSAGQKSEVVAVRIAGHEYKIRSDGNPETLREIAGYVDKAMMRVRERTGTVDTLDVAILTSLNLARDLLALHALRDSATTSPNAATGSAADALLVDETKLRELIEKVESFLPLSAEAPSEDSTTIVSSGSSKEAKGEDPAGQRAADEPARTIELPSVEALRESGQGGANVSPRGEAATRRDEAAVDGSAVDAMPEARMAAGGRDRSS